MIQWDKHLVSRNPGQQSAFYTPVSSQQVSRSAGPGQSFIPAPNTCAKDACSQRSFMV